MYIRYKYRGLPLAYNEYLNILLAKTLRDTFFN